jgi:hypothetical protein
MNKWITVVGLVLQLLGAGVAVLATRVTPHEAIELGMSRYGSDVPEENIVLPAVQNLLKQYRYARWGLLLIAAGTVFQIVGAVVTRAST